MEANNAQPPHFGQPTPTPHAQHQSISNADVVQRQPSAVAIAFRPIGDHFLKLGIVLTILCVLYGTCHPLFFTIPAIIFSTMAQDADALGNFEAAHSLGHIALSLNIVGLVMCTVRYKKFDFVGIIIAVAFVASAERKNC